MSEYFSSEMRFSNEVIFHSRKVFQRYGSKEVISLCRGQICPAENFSAVYQVDPGAEI